MYCQHPKLFLTTTLKPSKFLKLEVLENDAPNCYLVNVSFKYTIKHLKSFIKQTHNLPNSLLLVLKSKYV